MQRSLQPSVKRWGSSALHVLCGYSGVVLSRHPKWELFRGSQQRPPGRASDERISAETGGKCPAVAASR